VLEHLDGHDAIERVPAGNSSRLTSQVTISRFFRPRSAARASMNCFWVREFETPVMRALGYFSAIHSDSEPQPQPSSRMRSPSARRARWQVSASMRASAASRFAAARPISKLS
jgi:hypothetical protein